MTPLPSLLVPLLLGLAPAPPPPGGDPPFRVLVFHETAGFTHGSQITAGIQMIQELGVSNGFDVDVAPDSSAFTAASLAQYGAVVFLNTTGDVLDATEQAAFEQYVQAGGGFVGIHSAADTEYAWPFYGQLMGAWFLQHPPGTHLATLNVVDGAHESSEHLARSFEHTDEWYDFQTNPANDPSIGILLLVDETTYSGGTMGAPHPVAWYHEFQGGRAWYTALGHNVATYTAPFFREHVLGGILWASELTRDPAGALPKIDAVTPGSVPPLGPVEVTLDGTNFHGTVDVKVGGVPATAFDVVDNGRLRFEMPFLTAGGPAAVEVSNVVGPGIGTLTVVPSSPPALDLVETPAGELVTSQPVEIRVSTAPDDFVFVFMSPDDTPSTMPGVVDLAIGAGFQTLFVFPPLPVASGDVAVELILPPTGLPAGLSVHVQAGVLSAPLYFLPLATTGVDSAITAP